MARLIPLSDITAQHSDVLGNDYYDPTGQTAYGMNGEKIGTVRGALAEAETGKIRSLIVDVGGWFSSKDVVVPVGMAQFQGEEVHFTNLTKDQVGDMREYRMGEDYDTDAQYSDERVLRSAHKDYEADESQYAARTGYRDNDALYQTPDKLKLLEERLVVNKDRFVAGSVEVGKRVETHQENVNVDLGREEVVIERHAVTDAQPVEGAVLGADSQTMHVDLEAERANVTKQAFVTEEVTVGKREVTDAQTVTETVGREVLEVNKSGDVRLDSDGQAMSDRNDTRKG
ncbi:PRC and DUF2382 domain-containing protein [Deinococcus aerophilus]|uniref:Photosystem reaction center subunit H n=1 Tax=Deinococcus aerophilus TaxID=522488 RepID=A0ABQ2GIL9_9DEIO|nr:DUF2382 domain-containing protein [Deinococcus aerophilus]GGL97274.1 hypothetical protein GCM10010841_02020 [Deinococcus aerophilus]